ncbi:cellulose binding domain-containing protein [Kineosporia rhizophila]|uniref:GH12 family glycosyl hydrolase domain-containing protein n=1 Tax=Kineosporia TaxID=49184 RepID=UPI001E2DCD79|nr:MULTISPECIES: cellulose binding domain-containing protein [Kineosporia]MCE0536840.1 cellulose binding domain-containing protein [Kineosporia rhizophila]GLY13006.1 glycosyl hydrolase family 5 [Kineosporia sp. NBRC 101677]
MKARLIAAASAVAVAAGVTGGIVLSSPASAVNTTICGQYESKKVQGGEYIVQNNVWGTSAPQCIDASEDGFTITQQDGVNTGGAPTAYPSFVWGCHYNNCTNDFAPIKASSSEFDTIGSKATMKYNTGGVWNASYDIWFDPTARRDGQNTGAELMVWLNKAGGAQPVGSKVGTVTTAGGTWDVWFGNSGWNVISYVRTSAATSIDFKVSDFYDDAVQRGYAQSSWYMTSIQAGFEPWSGGKGLALSGFSVTKGAGGGNTTPTPPATDEPVIPPTTSPSTPVTTPPTTPPTTEPSNPGNGSTKCTADYKVTQSWNGGFLGEVTVKNTAGSATKNWKVDWSWPSGQKLVSSWNASAAQTGTKVSAGSLSYNGSVAGNGSTSFGMQVEGAPAAPKLTCSAA